MHVTMARVRLRGIRSKYRWCERVLVALPFSRAATAPVASGTMSEACDESNVVMKILTILQRLGMRASSEQKKMPILITDPEIARGLLNRTLVAPDGAESASAVRTSRCRAVTVVARAARREAARTGWASTRRATGAVRATAWAVRARTGRKDGSVQRTGSWHVVQNIPWKPPILYPSWNEWVTDQCRV